jgi:3-hydroxyacyl-CoA dehydrogenase / enoyl-CoA hydratase / 3-hydroxybutyryl-CoA epimerase
MSTARSNQAALDALAQPQLAMPTPAPEQPGFADYAHWRLVLDGDNALWAILDKADASTNTLSEAVLRELAALLDEARAANPAVLVIRSAKPNGFIAGAEIGELADMSDATVIEEKIGAGLAVLDTLEAFAKPTVALIHGFCLGGGLELALACRYRVATPDAKLGFPEVMLGLFPGLGGTWRSLRRMKPVDAMTAMLTGKTLIASKAKRQGLIDVVTQERHFAEAVRWAAAGRLTESRPKGLIDRAMTLSPVRGLVARRMESETAKKAPRMHYPAPYALIDLWRENGEDAAGWRNRGRETRVFAQLLLGGTSRNLVRCFFLREKLKGLAKGHEHGVKHVHVVGAGVMGADIAALCALRGFNVSLQDRDIGFIGPAVKRANAMFAKRLFSEAERRAALDRLMPDPQGIGLGKADLVIEAVPEDLEIKQAVYRACEAGMREDAILATNTSSILIESLHEGLSRPERFCGIHFFNPVDQMPLVELVTHGGLGATVRDRAIAFIAGLDKLPLPVTSSPGFLVNRALTPYIVEAFLIHSEGVKPEVIDAAAEAFGMPMGPIELADTVGLDVGVHVAEVLRRDLPQRPLPEVPGWLEKLVAQGKFGKKTGQGIYRWKNGKAQKAKVGEPPDPALQDRLILPLLNAVADCLGDGIVADTDAADAGMVFGTGFAPFRGGPLHYAKARGLTDVTEALRQLEERHGPRFAPSPGWGKV